MAMMQFWTPIVGFIAYWQTLIAGLVALGGAYITVRTMNQQAREATERKRRSARAMLPSTLDEIHNYALASIRWLENVREKAVLVEKGALGSNPVPVNVCPR